MAVFAETCRQRDSHVFTTPSPGAEGHVSGTVDYDIFGEPVTETGVFAGSAGGSGGISTLVFAYAGKPYDPVTGLSDYGFRDYAPTLARFTTVDPICAKRSCDRKFIIYVRSRERAIRDGSNWYAYCNSDPVNYVDMWGVYTCQDVSDLNNQLQSCYPGPNPLSDFIDLDKFAKVICQNADKLDDKTRAYVKSLGTAAEYVISRYLSDVKVYSNPSDLVAANGAIYQYTQNTQNPNIALGKNGTVDGLTVGNCIYMAGTISASNPNDIELLGHEFIHVLQGVAQGYAAFLTDYMKKTYDMSNEYEVAAYIFGGDITKPPFNAIPNMVKGFKTQVLKAYNIRR